MAKQVYSRREMLRLTGKLAAGSVLVTAIPACGGGGEGPFADCELQFSYTYPTYYGGEILYSGFYCDAPVYGDNISCFRSGYVYTCYEYRYLP